MNYMDIFLQKFGLTRYDVSQKTGISQQTLSSANKKDPQSYSGKVLMALSEATGISPGEVLDSILRIQRSHDYYLVRSWDEMKIALESQQSVFYVQGEFTEIMRQIKDGQLSDTAMMGTELGSAGTAGIIAGIVYWVYRQLKGGNKDEEKIKDKISKLYNIVLIDEKTVMLKLKSLNY